MTENRQNTLRRVLGAIISAITVIAGVLLIVQSQRIYHSAETTPYSYEKAREALSEIAAPLWIWLVAVFAGWLVWEIFPAPAQKTRAKFDSSEIAARLKKRLPSSLSQNSEVLRKSNVAKKIIWGVCIGICVICAALVGLVVWNKKYYTPVGDNFNPTRDMISMLPRILPFIVIAFAAAVFATIYSERLAAKDTAEIKKLLAENRATGAASAESAKNGGSENTASGAEVSGRLSAGLASLIAKTRTEQFKKRALYVTRGVLFVCGAAFMVLGAFNGGAQEMLEKAINICTECIGLG